MKVKELRQGIHILLDDYDVMVEIDNNGTNINSYKYDHVEKMLIFKSKTNFKLLNDVITKTINLSKCPECGGEADNGHNRDDPPDVYLCTKCQKKVGTIKEKCKTCKHSHVDYKTNIKEDYGHSCKSCIDGDIDLFDSIANEGDIKTIDVKDCSFDDVVVNRLHILDLFDEINAIKEKLNDVSMNRLHILGLNEEVNDIRKEINKLKKG